MQRATKPETHKGPAKGPAGIDTARDSTQSRRDSSREAQTETQTAHRQTETQPSSNGLKVINSRSGTSSSFLKPRNDTEGCFCT